jgi:predicted RNA binding protein YcfA (HicA-like mRNA interferase family)
MSTRKCKDVEAALVKKGFQRREGDHQYFVYHRSSDAKKTSVFTKISHGEREIGDFLLGQMAKQCKVNRADFLELVDCPLDRAGYEARLIEQGIVIGKGE